MSGEPPKCISSQKLSFFCLQEYSHLSKLQILQNPDSQVQLLKKSSYCLSFKRIVPEVFQNVLLTAPAILFGSFFLLLMAHPSGMHDQLQAKPCGIRILSSLCVMCFIFRVWMILFGSSSRHCQFQQAVWMHKNSHHRGTGSRVCPFMPWCCVRSLSSAGLMAKEKGKQTVPEADQLKYLNFTDVHPIVILTS